MMLWSGRWESNPRHQLGKLRYYHYTTPAREPGIVRIGAGEGNGGRGKLAAMTTHTTTSLLSLKINGEARSLAAPATVAALLDEMGLTGKRLAVERNGEIVPRGLHGSTLLADGDALEIVVAVGGG